MKLDSQTQQRRYMPIKCATVYQNRIWISSYLYNALYCYDYINNNMEYLGKFENQDMRENLHRQIIRYRDMLFFIPICADGIDVFNIKKQCFEDTIKSNFDEKVTNRIALQISDEIVWLFPQNIKESLYVLHTNMKTVEYLLGWKEEIENAFSDNDTYLVSASGICADGGKIYVAIYNKGIILEINRETLRIRKIFFDEKYHFVSINCLEGKLYLTEMESAGILQVEDDKARNKIENKEIDDVSIPYCGMVPVGNGFLVIPYHLNDFCILDIKRKKLQNAGIHFNKRDSSEPCFFTWQIYEENVFLYPARAQSILMINCQNLAVREIDVEIPEDVTNQWILKNRFEVHYKSKNVILNEDDFSLEEYIMLAENEIRMNIDSTENIGEKIYTSVNGE